MQIRVTMDTYLPLKLYPQMAAQTAHTCRQLAIAMLWGVLLVRLHKCSTKCPVGRTKRKSRAKVEEPGFSLSPYH